MSLNKAVVFSDIHFGRKANSPVHNQDCLDFITWVCSLVKQDPEIDHVVFMGDWHENRSAINISTLNYSHKGARLLNDLGIPVYFCVGNHDLFYRYTRDIHSLAHFEEFNNFKVINDIYCAPPSEVTGGMVLCPYLFHDEYQRLKQYLHVPTWMGHFEFRGFLVTGYGTPMLTGPDAEEFKGPKHIFSGHFHKRQTSGNVTYIGNTFPMDFGDADDNDRGVMIYDHRTNEKTFKNWEDCPKYQFITVTKLRDGNVTLHPNARVKCVIDVPLTFEESTLLRQQYCDESYKLREFVLEESQNLNELIASDIEAEEGDQPLATVHQLVMQMLTEIKHDQIDNDLLKAIYNSTEDTSHE